MTNVVDQEEYTCGICFDRLGSDESLIHACHGDRDIFNTRHVFHRACLRNWWNNLGYDSESLGSCPLCRNNCENIGWFQHDPIHNRDSENSESESESESENSDAGNGSNRFLELYTAIPKLWVRTHSPYWPEFNFDTLWGVEVEGEYIPQQDGYVGEITSLISREGIIVGVEIRVTTPVYSNGTRSTHRIVYEKIENVTLISNNLMTVYENYYGLNEDITTFLNLEKHIPIINETAGIRSSYRELLNESQLNRLLHRHNLNLTRLENEENQNEEEDTHRRCDMLGNCSIQGGKKRNNKTKGNRTKHKRGRKNKTKRKRKL
jgi:hypothetical protein